MACKWAWWGGKTDPASRTCPRGRVHGMVPHCLSKHLSLFPALLPASTFLAIETWRSLAHRQYHHRFRRDNDLIPRLQFHILTRSITDDNVIIACLELRQTFAIFRKAKDYNLISRSHGRKSTTLREADIARTAPAQAERSTVRERRFFFFRHLRVWATGSERSHG